MSLKAGFILFYVAFMSITVFFSASMAETILTGVSEVQLSELTDIPVTGDPFYDFINFVFNVGLFGWNSFGSLLLVSTEFRVLFLFVVLPLSITLLWVMIEMVRGN